MPTVTIEEAQAKLPELVRQLPVSGEIAILEGDHVVAKIVSERSEVFQRPGPGLCKDMMTIVAEDEEHLKDFAEYMP